MGLSRACECLSRWLPADRRFRPCPFWTESHVFHRRYRLSSQWKYCQYPDIDMIGATSNATTIFCLGRHSLIWNRIPILLRTRLARFTSCSPSPPLGHTYYQYFTIVTDTLCYPYHVRCYFSNYVLFPESSARSHITNILLL